MNYSKKDLIIFALFILSFYLHFFKKETFTNVNLEKDAKGNFVIPGNLKINGTVGVRRDPDPKMGVLINGDSLGGAMQSNGTVYVYGDSILQHITSKGKPITGGSNADAEAIRNLSKLANDLTKNGKLVVPGGLEIKGNLKVGGNVGVKRDPHPKVGLIVNAAGLAQGVETQGAGVYCDKNLIVNGTSKLNGNVGVKRDPHPKVGLIVNAAGLLVGVETQGAGVYADKALHVNGTTRLEGNVGVKRDPHPKVGLIVNAAGLAQGVETQGAGIYADKSLRVQGNTRLNGNVGVRREVHPKVGLIVNGAGLSQGVETVSAGIYCDKNLIVTGTSKLNGNVGVRRDPHSKVGLFVNGDGMTVGMETNTNIHTRDLMATRYIGARNEIASTAGLYAKCSSVNNSGYGSSCSKKMN